MDSLLEAALANAEAARDATTVEGGVNRPDSASTYALATRTLVEAAQIVEINGLDREHAGVS